jgi:hypothetical protein
MEINNVKIEGYHNYSSSNYGINALSVTIGTLKLYFSYDTVIAFRDNGNLVIRKNDWSTVTGKHLNSICTDKKIRINGTEFNLKLNEVLRKYGLVK